MTKLQFRVLFREFLFRMVDLEVLSSHAQGDIGKLLGQFAALLVFVSVGLSMMAFGFADSRMPPPARLIFSLVSAHFLIATTMLVVGLFAVLSWDSTFPNRRDVLVLAPLPVRARTMFLAKVAAVATALGLTVATLHLAAGFVWPLAFARQATAQALPTLAFSPATAPIDAAGLESVLTRDLSQALTSGPLAPGTGAGLAIGVSKHGVRRIITYGTAKADSLFEIGSITKTFTGLMLAQMVEQGRVRLNEPVRELLPPGTVSKPAGEEITLLDLATQHSGLPSWPSNLNTAGQPNPGADYHTSDLYAYVSKRGVGKPAGVSFFYSNLGFGLLAQALAERAGVSYAQLLQEEVTGPLGLRDTVVSLSPEQQTRMIQGYAATHRRVPAWDLDALAGAGAIRSTAGDMLTYLEANLHPERLSDAGTLSAALAQSHRLRADAALGMRIALAWVYRTDAGIYWHNGAISGYTSQAFFDPAGETAAVVLLNHAPDIVLSPDVLAEHIRQRLAGEPAISLDTVWVPASSGFLGTIRWFAAYWFTMFAAGSFIFCCVLGVQGAAAQFLPRRLFLRASAFLQMASFCLFVCVYFLQPAFAGLEGLIAPETRRLVPWLPPYWFLGLFQQLNGSMHPLLAPMARRAWMGLAIALGGTSTAYVFSYFRTLRKIVEEPDIAPGSRRGSWLPRFGSALPTAVVQFSIRTLLRSRQHRVILAFYLGIAFALVIFFTKTPVAQQQLAAASESDPWHHVNAPLLASSIVMMGFWIVGTRIVFSLPLDLRANWIFRVTPVQADVESLAARRRSLFALSVIPVWMGAAVLFLWLWPWRVAGAHLIVLLTLGATLAEFCLHGFHKIPFTCSYLPGRSNVHLTILFCVGYLMALVGKAAEFELRALQDGTGYVALLAVLGALLLLVRWRSAGDKSELDFEAAPEPVILTLGLHRDGALPIEPLSPEVR